MAREFSNVTATPTQDGIVYSAIPPIGGLGKISMVVRAALDSDTPTNGVIFECANASTYEMVGFARVGSDSSVYFVCRNNNAGSIPYCTINYNGTVRSIIGTFDGSASPKVVMYVDGVSQTIMGSAPINTTIGSGHTFCNIGARSGRNGMNGRIAEAAIYNRIITPEEAAMHAAGYSCLHFQRGLIFYAPLIRDVQDIAGGLPGTITGTTVADHPRIYA